MGYNEKELQEKLQKEKENIILPPKKETVGDILKNKRQEQGLSLDKISSDLRIKSQYLQALEENRFNALPGSAYVIGFIKSYASYLNLNSADIISIYKQETASSSLSDMSLIEDENSLIRDPVINSNHIIIGSVVVLVGILFIYLVNNRSNDDVATVKSEAEVVEMSETPSSDNLEISLPSTNISTSEVSLDADIDLVSTPEKKDVKETSVPEYFETKIDSVKIETPEQPAETVADNEKVGEDTATTEQSTSEISTGREYGLANKDDAEIYVKATKKIWIKLKKDGLYKYDSELGDVGTGSSVFETILEPGDIYYIPNGENYYLTIGNAQGIDIYADGELIKPLSTKEVSRHNIEMNVEKLKNGTAYIRNRVIE